LSLIGIISPRLFRIVNKNFGNEALGECIIGIF